MAPRRRAAAHTPLKADVLISRALDIADAEGLNAVTIRRLAQEYDVTPMALYWHFKDKEQLVDGIAEQLFAQVAAPEDSFGPWHERLRRELTAFLEAMRPHPAVAGLAPARILASEAGLTVADRILGLLRTAGFPSEDAAEVGSYLLCAIVTLITSEPGPSHQLADEPRADAVRGRRAHINSLPPQKFPNVVAAADALADCRNEDTYYARGIALLVEGTKGIRRSLVAKGS
ncbi:TetR/AcrR family transcriptional regulator [Streptomyces tremellae]|uniref:TetR/AcrR family transcriptional regulator n=1 Tax=Streptomyces tremellae TaxID=1124239 RepID=UPI0031F19F76